MSLSTRGIGTRPERACHLEVALSMSICFSLDLDIYIYRERVALALVERERGIVPLPLVDRVRERRIERVASSLERDIYRDRAPLSHLERESAVSCGETYRAPIPPLDKEIEIESHLDISI